MKVNNDTLMAQIDTITNPMGFKYLTNSIYSEVESEEIGWDSKWVCEDLKLTNPPTRNGFYRFFVHTGVWECRFTETETPSGTPIESKVFTNLEYGLKEMLTKYAILGVTVQVKGKTVTGYR